MIIQLIPLGCFQVYATDQPPPTNLAVTVENGRPVISYSAAKGYYAKLEWTAPITWSGDEQHYELHYRAEDENVYQVYGGIINRSVTEIEMQNLKSGTVYHAHVHAIHEHTPEEGGAVDVHDEMSEEILFLTDTSITVEPGENESLNIKWDKVTYDSASVSYDVYISESASFAETSPVRVGPEDIGIGKPVEIDGTQLVYNAVDLKPSTVYYVKIRTVIDDDGRVICLPVSASSAGFTTIRTEINRISSEWWKLEWNPITNTDLSEDDQILYKVIRSVDGDLEKEIAGTKDTNLLVKVPTENTYFIIQADLVSQIGTNLSVVSEKIYAAEEEIVAVPPVPQILDGSTEQHTEVGSNDITLLWEAPYSNIGNLDTDVYYDIWVLENSADIDNGAINPTVKDLTVGESDYVYEKIGNVTGDRIIAFKHTLSNLDPNTVYYIKIVAKKDYTINNVTSTATSEPALKVFVTLPDGAIDQPVVPLVPPFKVKTNLVNGAEIEAATSDSITLQWKNQWYEMWDSANSKWIYIADEDVTEAESDGEICRLINYGSDIKYSVGYEVYTNSFDYTRLLEATASMPMQITGIPNTTTSTTVEYTVSGLEPNTAYIFWMRAYRTDSIKSELSDPIIVSTRPDYEVPLEKPAIPVISYKYAGDTYVDMIWDVTDDYSYEIKYGIYDDISKATGDKLIESEELKSSTKYRINSLTADTDYYFWIRAILKGTGTEEEMSDWSDSYLIKTTEYAPPDPPKGFGIKNIDNPIGKDYIYFEWIYNEGLKYNMQIAKKSDFSDAVSYPSLEVSEYKVEKLDANTRYYARLFAYDPDKDLTSASSSVISVKTLTSNDEYDTISDTELPIDVPKPEFDENDDDIAVLNVKYENTDMFIEQIYSSNSTDFVVNFEGLNPDEDSSTNRSEGVETSKTTISPRILIALEQKKQNLVLDNGPVALVLKPGIMQSKQLINILNNDPGCMMEIVLQKISNPTNKTTGSSYVSNVWEAALDVVTNSGKTKLTSLEGLKIRVPYYNIKWFDKSTMTGAVYDAVGQQWSRVDTGSSFDLLNLEGMVYFTLPGSCDFAVMKMSGGKFSDITTGTYANEIKAIVEKYDLKCLGDGNFEPSKTVSKEEAVKIMLDILEYGYDEDYLIPAKKAGITANVDVTDTTLPAKRAEGLAMVTRLCELMTGNKVQDTNTDWYSTDSFSRGQMMVLLKSMLEKAGVF